jgi:hypothetical protein
MLVSLLAAGADAGAPEALLEGHVVSRGTRRSIAVASIAVDGVALAETDAAGAFTLLMEPGAHTVTVSAAGFEPRMYAESLAPGTHLTVRYALDPRGVQPYETVVRDERARTEVARIAIEGPAMREIAGTGGDPLRATMLMPGVTSPVSGIGYPIVRGSSPSATGYFLDGVRIPQLFHDFIGPAVVHADLIDRVELLSGGAGVPYGRLLSGVVDARVKRPADDGPHAEAHASVTSAGALAETVVEKTGTALTLAGNASYSAPLFGALAKAGIAHSSDGGPLVADFWDYQGRLEQPLLGGALRLFALGSSDAFGRRAEGRMSSSLIQSLRFHRVDLRYRHPLGPGELEAGVTWSWDQAGFDAQQPMLPDTHTLIRQQAYAARLSWSATLLSSLTASAGATVDHLLAALSSTGLVSQPESIATFLGAWAQLRWQPLRKLTVTGGVRADVFAAADAAPAAVDARLAVAWAESDALSVHAYAGSYHQPPSYLINVPLADIATLSQGLQQTVQLGAGFTWRPLSPLELIADAYYDAMPRVVEVSLSGRTDGVVFNPTDPMAFSAPLATVTSGRAYGLDLQLRWAGRGPVFGWLTFTAQRSVRLRTFATDPLDASSPRLQADLPFAFDQTFVANAVVGVRLPLGFQVGAVVHYNSGAPESGALGSSTLEPKTFAVGTDTVQVWSPVRLDQTARLPPYFRLDLRASKTWLADAFSVELYLDLLNASFQSEVLSYAYFGGLGQPLQKIPNTAFVFVPSLGLRGRY